MIGGFATRFHGYNRTTDDIDLRLEDISVNRKNLQQAFIDFGYGDYGPIAKMNFIAGWATFHAAGIELDIVTTMKGLRE
ncbi:MAG TPA: hypothetical protein VMT76_05885 [Puia sp.]|nr:hypothetical protein [Puia sp.]